MFPLDRTSLIYFTLRLSRHLLVSGVLFLLYLIYHTSYGMSIYFLNFFHLLFLCLYFVYFTHIFQNIISITAIISLLFIYWKVWHYLSIYCTNIWCSPVLASPLNNPLKMTAGVMVHPFSQMARNTPRRAQIVGIYLLSTSLIHFFTTYPTQRHIPTMTKTKYSDKNPKSIKNHPYLLYASQDMGCHQIVFFKFV